MKAEVWKTLETVLNEHGTSMDVKYRQDFLDLIAFLKGRWWNYHTSLDGDNKEKGLDIQGLGTMFMLFKEGENGEPVIVMEYMDKMEWREGAEEKWNQWLRDRRAKAKAKREEQAAQCT